VSQPRLPFPRRKAHGDVPTFRAKQFAYHEGMPRPEEGDCALCSATGIEAGCVFCGGSGRYDLRQPKNVEPA
jgi:hypothetical protein